MLTRTKKIAFAAAIILGTASAALAGNGGEGPTQGGADIGPLGQCFNPPDCGGKRDTAATHYYGNGGNAYGFVPQANHKHPAPR
jgi:hypothetical protein